MHACFTWAKAADFALLFCLILLCAKDIVYQAPDSDGLRRYYILIPRVFFSTSSSPLPRLQNIDTVCWIRTPMDSGYIIYKCHGRLQAPTLLSIIMFMRRELSSALQHIGLLDYMIQVQCVGSRLRWTPAVLYTTVYRRDGEARESDQSLVRLPSPSSL